MPRFFPLGVDLQGSACVVVGGGRIGTRKAETLLGEGARVTVIAPRVSARLAELHAAGALLWVAEPFREEAVDRALLVVAATDDATVNAAVVRAARERGALVCDASSAARSQVIFGALHRTDRLTLAVFTNGEDPALARQVRDRVANQATAALAGDTGSAPGGDARLIVIAHGSRDPRWRASLETVIGHVQALGAGATISLAYMDRAAPTLLDAVNAAVQAGCRQVRVLPLFLAPEGHVDRDIRPLVEQARAAHPDIHIEFMPPIGQLPGFRRLLSSLASEQAAPAVTGRSAAMSKPGQSGGDTT